MIITLNIYRKVKFLNKFIDSLNITNGIYKY